MKKLISLAIGSQLVVEGFNSDYQAVQAYLEKHQLDGVEMIMYGDDQIDLIPQSLVVGQHLLYWPNWIDFWQGNQQALLKDFLNKKNIMGYYGFESPDAMITYYKKEFKGAKKLQAEYMVYHVSNASFEDIFTYNHKYHSRLVMTAAIELINQVFVGDGPLLLFENLMWPGLTYTDPLLTQWFYDQIAYKNKGFVLDISHLMATNSTVKSEEEGIAYVHEVLDSMGSLVAHIKAIHLNKTIAGAYLQEDHSEQHRRFLASTDMMERYEIIHQHITQIDGHMPFDHPGVMTIIQRVQPDYLVYELKANSMDELTQGIDLQNSYITTLAKEE